METIEIGTILRPQGLKGELKVSPNIHDLKVFLRLKTVFVGSSEGVPVQIVSASVRNGVVYLNLSSCTSIDQAELLRNKTLFAYRNDVQPKKQEGYLIVDLIGINVVDQNGKLLGVLEDVDQFGAADVLSVRGDGRIWLVPYLNDLVIKVDLESKEMVFNKELYWELRICD